ncbi:hypothetical protein, partial [Shigella boydii]
GAGRTSDGNGSHASTLKSPSYTKSVSWQHYLASPGNSLFELYFRCDITLSHINIDVRLLFKPTFAHILSIADRKHSHYHCVVDYLISPLLANHLVSCRCQTPHEVVIQLMRNK